MFLNRHNPNSVYIKSNIQALESISDDLFKTNILSRQSTPSNYFLYYLKGKNIFLSIKYNFILFY